jgi:hypothetical protein
MTIHLPTQSCVIADGWPYMISMVPARQLPIESCIEMLSDNPWFLRKIGYQNVFFDKTNLMLSQNSTYPKHNTPG